MAVPGSVYKSSFTIDAVSRSLSSLGQGLNKSRKVLSNISKSVVTNNQLKRKSLVSSSLLFQKRRENIRRKKQRSLLELSKIGSVFTAPAKVISTSTKGLLGRMLDFAGTVMAGWLIYNLPTLIGMSRELRSRVVRLTQILGEFLPNTGRILSGLGDVIGAYAINFLTFDFLDSNKRVESSMKNLNDAFSGMNASFNEALTIITTPLTEGLDGRPDSPPFGSDGEQPQESTPSGGGSDKGNARVGTREQRALLDTIAEAEGTYKSGYSTWLGHRKHGPENLTNLTIDQVHDLQGSFLKKFGAPSAAVGRYQFVPLREHAKRFGANTATQKFTPEFQDRLAIFLAENRGVDTKTPIDSSDVLKLGREWAALPGGGYGQDLYTVKQVLSMYQNRLKTTPVNPPAPPSLPQVPPPKTTPSARPPNQSSLPPLPPTGTLPGGVQAYGAPRDDNGDGKPDRKHAGVDFDISGPSAKFYSRIGGVVVGSPFRYGDDGWAIDIYNQQLGVYERIAEAAKVLVKPGQKVNPGDAVVQGESRTGVIHYEIRKKQEGGYENSVDPIAFLQNATPPSSRIAAAPKQQSVPPPAAAASTPTPAQISRAEKPSTPPVAVAPDRSGPTVILTQQEQPPQIPFVSSSPSQQQPEVTVVEMPLNKVMANRLLLQLAYT